MGIGQGMHEVPHELVLVFGWQVPEQSWLPLGQTPEHDAFAAIHVPAHSFIPDGQVPPQLVPSQVAVPPLVGAEHATQEEPHDAIALLLAQVDPQTW